MRVMAFDFDGVLCDSSRELFVVAVDALNSQAPDSPILGRLKPLRDDALAGGVGFHDDPIYHRFTDILPLGNRAEDFGVALRVIEADLPIASQADYDNVYRETDPKWRDEFHRRFYESRERLRTADLQRWLGLHLPYPEVGRALERHRGTVRPAVITAKDARSVHLLLSELELENAFDPRLIFDKETGVEKTVHLTELQRRLGVPFGTITFVDDKVNHLEKVAGLGVRCILAGWGFNTEREHSLARTLGFEVAQLDNLDLTLFKGE